MFGMLFVESLAWICFSMDSLLGSPISIDFRPLKGRSGLHGLKAEMLFSGWKFWFGFRLPWEDYFLHISFHYGC